MMKKLFFLTLMALTSCAGQNEVEKALKDYVYDGFKSSKGFNTETLDYHLVNYQILDTLTNKDMLDSLESKLRQEAFVWYEPTKDSLLKIKETRFPKYFLQDKDALAEVQKHRNTIDSLISVWENVTPLTYELNYEGYWFYVARCTAYDMEPGEYISKHFDGMVENKDNYHKADSLSKLPSDDFYAYKIKHDYSYFNPLLNKKINISQLVFLDKDFKIIQTELLNSGENMLKQITE